MKRMPSFPANRKWACRRNKEPATRIERVWNRLLSPHRAGRMPS